MSQNMRNQDYLPRTEVGYINALFGNWGQVDGWAALLPRLEVGTIYRGLV